MGGRRERRVGLDAMDDVVRIIERSNQRGGRMLSVTDLVDADTFSLEQAAWVLARVRDGASWLVGARPGGAGKTTVMSAMLAALPSVPAIRLTNPGTGWEASEPGECVVAYEVGRGAYDAYVWGQAVRRMAALAARGVRVVTNLHADTLEEAAAQIVTECGVTSDGFLGFGMFLPVTVSGGWHGRTRRVDAISVAHPSGWSVVERERAARDAPADVVRFLEVCLREEVREVSSFRRRWLRHLDASE